MIDHDERINLCQWIRYFSILKIYTAKRYPHKMLKQEYDCAQRLGGCMLNHTRKQKHKIVWRYEGVIAYTEIEKFIRKLRFVLEVKNQSCDGPLQQLLQEQTFRNMSAHSKAGHCLMVMVLSLGQCMSTLVSISRRVREQFCNGKWRRETPVGKSWVAAANFVAAGDGWKWAEISAP